MKGIRWKFGSISAVLLAGTLSLSRVLAQDYDPSATLNLATNADPTLNPWTPGAVVESNLINTIVFDQLVRYNKKDLSPAPGLATSWKVSQDGLSWTFHLRKGVTWHDGKPFTAEDVAFTFNDVVLNKKLGAQNAGNFSKVKTVEVVNPYTVRFVLNAPFSSLPYYLAYYAGILPKHVLGNADNPLQVASFNKKNPIGTGAFQVAEFVPGSYVRLVKYEKYWGGTPKISSIVFKIVPDPNTQMAQAISGELDFVGVSNPALLAGAERNPKLQVLRQSQNLYYFVALNQNDPRFRDVRVRQALLYAIDRKAMIDSVVRGYGTIATGPIAPLQKAFYVKDVPQYPYNPEKAKQLLAQAGWTPGPDGVLQKDGKPFEIDMPTGQFGYLVPATLLVQQYWKAIGVKANVNVMEWNAYIQKMFVNRQYEATLAWWSTPPTPDVTPYYASSAADKGNNIPNYKNPELDKLLEEGLKATGVQEQVLIYRRIQRLLAEQLPYLYLWYPDIISVRNERVGGMADINTATAFQYSSEWFIKR
ncbi:ABC transporter substrate-binding protein [Meiothermus sp. Pnk-1]|uniref:ABC transporter substrate-binding protein n=1 Tax=Meiothermus sp. Pnk-1 TaxID=873128 RepID=UPI000D7CAAA2|nr:ABC transporter substrate-binding protein [Meiothermus sp. Pnk-1]PZA07515.1 ABC transporter substrate-binding protein [Meiothermus sp. Pnk-1]